MKALLTGSSGFLGRHVLAALDRRGARVEAVQTRDVEPEIGALTARVRDFSPDFVLHMAGKMTGGPGSDFWRTNVMWGAVLLDALQDAGLPQVPVLFIGTAAEYGMLRADELPVREEHACAPVGPYGISKYSQTLMALEAARAGRRVVVAREANLLGPGLPTNFALANFAQQIARIERGEAPPVIEVGNLDSARDFVDARDVAPLLVDLAQNPRAHGQVVNISCGTAIPIRVALDRMVAQARVGVEVRVDPARLKGAEVSAFSADPARLYELAGPVAWRPLDESLGDMLEYARKERQ